MGTLSGLKERLPGYCEHKLPTSCQLTSIPGCCACADERSHAPSYPTYIDGIGFVSQGTRWQRYCWYCCKFWENRVAITNLRPAQTRLPDRPDQKEFLTTWYEFHRGYRIVTQQDGSERRVALLGEPWNQVEPGHLPRTLDELRAGRLRNSADERQHIEIEEDTTQGPSIEETLDSLLADAENGGEDPFSHNRIAGNVMQATGPIHTDTTERERRRAHDRAIRERRTAENFRRVFGSREEVESEDYVSPINRMFERARRYRPPPPAPLHPDVEAAIRASLAMPPPEASTDPLGLDVDDTRPGPKSDEDMMVKLNCKVCYTQLADTVFLPCGHLIMCKWCSDQHCPTLEHDHTRPSKSTTCPLCRKSVKQKYNVKLA
ncbi:hypothetical protein K461DRAFT_280584 [Myriangium duriaei CBS 260.36]|uniref:RING-type domain-containing protein n=1 Tax=Myriangium duriaei CBS 260.36 TaxID=1168546 RepID=A0A9P4MF20_9PEZI|nr:hypothetical protein K461DRAFT_280584 [Myriangium duriaei CBS 260.36]